jgi:hypothetical protein
MTQTNRGNRGWGCMGAKVRRGGPAITAHTLLAVAHVVFFPTCARARWWLARSRGLLGVSMAMPVLSQPSSHIRKRSYLPLDGGRRGRLLASRTNQRNETAKATRSSSSKCQARIQP